MAGTGEEQPATLVSRDLRCDPGGDYRLFEGLFRNADGADMRSPRRLSVHDNFIGAFPGDEIRSIFGESSMQLLSADREVQEGVDRDVQALAATKVPVTIDAGAVASDVSTSGVPTGPGL